MRNEIFSIIVKRAFKLLRKFFLNLFLKGYRGALERFVPRHIDCKLARINSLKGLTVRRVHSSTGCLCFVLRVRVSLTLRFPLPEIDRARLNVANAVLLRTDRKSVV